MSKDLRIVVYPTPPGVRGTYPAANWIAKPTTVTLLDEYPGRTVDVLDVRLSDGTMESVYGFNVEENPHVRGPNQEKGTEHEILDT